MKIIILQPNHQYCSLDVNPTDRILYLKAKINQILGIQVNDQMMFYKGMVLEDDKTIDYYSIEDDSAIYLNPSDLITLTIKTLMGIDTEVSISPFSSVNNLKHAVQKKIGIPPCQQRLIFAGHQLEDEVTLQESSIGDHSTLHLVTRLKGGKPVIYLYPEQDNFDVSVSVDMRKEIGEITSRYPLINAHDGNTWKVKANRNGELMYNNRKHYYLFWECEFDQDFDFDEGFVIEGHQSYQFFEEKLEYLGFKENEANDFITYWCPKIEHHPYVLIKFQGEQYDSRALLQIEPRPDCLRRIFVTFKPLQNPTTIPQQNIDQFRIDTRNGFFVLEWGGSLIQKK